MPQIWALILFVDVWLLTSQIWQDSLALGDATASRPKHRERSTDKAKRPDDRHRPSKSQEEALKRARRKQDQASRPDVSKSPQRKPQRRPRRNSDSSVIDGVKTGTDAKGSTDAKDRSRRDGKDRSRSGKPSRRLDIIDQLDATSIYGTGRKCLDVHITELS